MTAKQKAARLKFKKVVAEATKLRKKNPKLTQAQAVKQAWAIQYSKEGKSKKVAAIKIIEKGESKSSKPKATYQQVRSKKGTFKGLKKISGNRTIKLEKARRIADQWHGGQLSALYQFASSGIIVPKNYTDYQKEIQENINIAKTNKDIYELHQLSQYLSNTFEKMNKKVGAAKSSEYHKDTKSHNVNIRVVSGYKKPMYSMGNVDTKKLLDQIAKESKLRKDVVTILKSKAKDYSNDYKSLLKDILYSGLQSGIISELVYYSDTLKWYNKHKSEIKMLLREMMSSYGTNNPADLFGRNWDQDDPFVEDTTNKNLLAWFSFEETAREIADRLGYEI